MWNLGSVEVIITNALASLKINLPWKQFESTYGKSARWYVCSASIATGSTIFHRDRWTRCLQTTLSNTLIQESNFGSTLAISNRKELKNNFRIRKLLVKSKCYCSRLAARYRSVPEQERLMIFIVRTRSAGRAGSICLLPNI